MSSGGTEDSVCSLSEVAVSGWALSAAYALCCTHFHRSDEDRLHSRLPKGLFQGAIRNCPTPAQPEQAKKRMCYTVFLIDIIPCPILQVLQVGLSELFHARLGQTDDERTKDLASDAGLDVLLLERVQKPSPGVFSEEVSLIYFAIFATCIFSSCCQVIHRDVTDAVGSVWIGRSNTRRSVRFWMCVNSLGRRFWDVCANTERLQCSVRSRVSWKSLLRALRSNTSTLTRHSATAQTAKTPLLHEQTI